MILTQFMTKTCGEGAAGKFVPDWCVNGPLEFVRELLNGYFSGDGYVNYTSIVSSSVVK